VKETNQVKHLILAFAAILLLFSAGLAQDGHQHRHDATEKLGEVNFETSCNRHAQMAFNRAVAARSARLMKDRKKVTRYYSMLMKQCRAGDTSRPELNEAKAFVSN
jgi:Skp family chaperone for outer membrane proteins